jgi:hypothetical protein
MTCSLLAFLLFAGSAEGTTTAYDEKDLLKYVYFLLWYNLGVILIGGAIGALLYFEFKCHYLNFLESNLHASPWLSHALLYCGFGVAFFVCFWRWIRDFWWLLFREKSKFDEYLRELKDEDGDSLRDEHGIVMRLVFRHRGA